MATSNGSRGSKTFVGLSTTHDRLQTFTIHVVDSWYVDKNNEIFIESHDAECNSTNHISEYVSLSSIDKSSITKDKNYYAIWKTPQTGAYANVYYECLISATESDVIPDDGKTIKIHHNDDSQQIHKLNFNFCFKNTTLPTIIQGKELKGLYFNCICLHLYGINIMLFCIVILFLLLFLHM